MELKEYYKILKSNFGLVIYTVLILIVVAYAWSVRKSQTYSASLILNISRDQTQATTDYRYDQFYKLQADDKFAETIVEWLKTPGVAKEIFDKSDLASDQKTMRQLSKSFQAEKVSSNLIRLQYSAPTNEEAAKIAPSIESVLSEKIKDLNSSAKNPDWFRVDMSNLIILQNIQNLWLNLGLAALAGLFLGAMLVFGKHYIAE